MGSDIQVRFSCTVLHNFQFYNPPHIPSQQPRAFRQASENFAFWSLKSLILSILGRFFAHQNFIKNRTPSKTHYTGVDPKLNSRSIICLGPLVLGYLSWVICLGPPVLGHLSWVTCPGAPVLGHRSRVTCHGSPLLGHLSCVTCVLGDLSWVICTG